MSKLIYLLDSDSETVWEIRKFASLPRVIDMGRFTSWGQSMGDPWVITHSWRYAEGVYIAKESSENIDQFLIIFLLSVESKIFSSVVAKRLSNFRNIVVLRQVCKSDKTQV